jgi:hypothetical protein
MTQDINPDGTYLGKLAIILGKLYLALSGRSWTFVAFQGSTTTRLAVVVGGTCNAHLEIQC